MRGFWLALFSPPFFLSCSYIYFVTFPVQSPQGVSKSIRERRMRLKLAGLAKNLAPYRIGKRPHKQNRAKIHQKYRKSYFFCIFDFFGAILRVAVFSYPVGGQVFPKIR